MLQLELDSESNIYRPGSVISGIIHWRQEKAPKELVASLVWYTQGKGDTDSDIVVEQKWNPTSEQGSQKFQWLVPRGPLSHDSSLIRICWRVEAATSKPKDSAVRELIVSHLDRPINSHSS